MYKQIATKLLLVSSVILPSVSSAAVINTATQYVFNDLNGDTNFDFDDYAIPDFQYSIQANQFNDEGGKYTLVGAVITLDGFLLGEFGYENRSGSAIDVDGVIASELELTTSTGISLVTVLPTFDYSTTIDAYDGRTDFAGTSGGTIKASPEPITSSEIVTVTDASKLALFLGNSTIDLNILGFSRSETFNTGGSFSSYTDVLTAGTMSIFYQYEVTSVPVSAPNMLALLAGVIGFAGLSSRRKR
jgi:hypothetical protein